MDHHFLHLIVSEPTAFGRVSVHPPLGTRASRPQIMAAKMAALPAKGKGREHLRENIP